MVVIEKVVHWSHIMQEKPFDILLTILLDEVGVVLFHPQRVKFCSSGEQYWSLSHVKESSSYTFCAVSWVGKPCGLRNIIW